MSASYYQKKFREMLEIQAFVSLYLERFEDDYQSNREAFAMGWIESLTDKQVILKSVSARGFYDGFALVPLAYVHCALENSSVDLRRAKLYDLRREQHPKKFLAGEYLSGEDLLEPFLREAMLREVPVEVGIDINVEGVHGYVVDLTNDDGEENVTLSMLHSDGRHGGQFYFPVNRLIWVKADTQELSDLALLSGQAEDMPPGW